VLDVLPQPPGLCSISYGRGTGIPAFLLARKEEHEEEEMECSQEGQERGSVGPLPSARH